MHNKDVHVFPRAEIAGSRLLSCRYLTQASRTESFWVHMDFWDLRRGVWKLIPTIGSIQYFFTLRTTLDESGCRGTFYAVVRLYEASTVRTKGYYNKPVYRINHKVYDTSTHERHTGLRVIPLSWINQKMVKFQDLADENPTHSYWYFIGYNSTSLR